MESLVSSLTMKSLCLGHMIKLLNYGIFHHVKLLDVAIQIRVKATCTYVHTYMIVTSRGQRYKYLDHLKYATE